MPEDLVGKRDTYVLRVRGDSMIDEQIRDGDFVVVEDRKTADNGEMVIALLRGSDVTLKKFYREPGGKIRLQPANAAMQPIFVDLADQVPDQGVVVGVMREVLETADRHLHCRSDPLAFDLPPFDLIDRSTWGHGLILSWPSPNRSTSRSSPTTAGVRRRARTRTSARSRTRRSTSPSPSAR